MDANFDTCIVIRNKEGNISHVIVHDVTNRKKILLKTEEIGMEETLELITGHKIAKGDMHGKIKA